ncbi:UNVERIFIED_CONTAM: hypothetical protein Sangu_2963700 [Sesamum angustifolium]|uniref:Uncharacterized protein n=1 Tax=Sesamum angustifolium TaxID=2727405 RepID=A0AAW2IJN6_9LAMI
MIASAIREQSTVIIPPIRVATPSEVIAPKQVDLALAIPRPNVAEGPSTQLPTQVGDVPPQWLAQLEHLQKKLQDVQYQVMGASTKEKIGIPLTE